MEAFWVQTRGRWQAGDAVDAREYEDFRGRVMSCPLVAADVTPGGVVQPGQIMEAALRALAEMTFEAVRLEHRSSGPSRLDSLFLWPTERQARDYCNKETLCVLRVAIIQERQRFEGPWSCVVGLPLPLTVSRLREHALRYWRADDPTEDREILLDGMVRVVEELP